MKQVLKTAASWTLVVAVAFLLSTPEAHAGKGGKKGGAPAGTSVADLSDADLDALIDASSTSEIDPTSVPIVSGDFYVNPLNGQPLTLWNQPAAMQIRAPQAHEKATGRDVTVAVLDSGFNLSHPDIVNNLAPIGYDTLDGDDDPEDFGNGLDDDGDGVIDEGVGHGTFVAGMVLMAAPDATILPIRVRDDEGWGSNRALVDGIFMALDMGADVINISGALGASHNMVEIARAVLHVTRLGAIVVAAAGNDDSSLDPYSDTFGHATLVVGAVDANDAVAEFSNTGVSWVGGAFAFGPGVDLFGPLGSNDERGFWSGTSFAAGIGSGACALAVECWPNGKPERLVAKVAAAVDYVTEDGVIIWPAGRFDLERLVK